MTHASRLVDPSLPAGYSTRSFRVSTAVGTLRLAAPVSQREVCRLRPEVLAAAQDGEGPHWARPWESGLGVARFLARAGSLAGLEIWDVGCGLGLAGLAAGRRGARVVFADRDPDALRFVAHNARRNGLDDFEVRSFDWSTERPSTCAAMLVLADVCYSFRRAREVGRMIDHVRAAGGDVLLADPFRGTANDLWRTAGGGRDVGSGRVRVHAARIEVAPIEGEGERVPVRLLGVGEGVALDLLPWDRSVPPVRRGAFSPAVEEELP